MGSKPRCRIPFFPASASYCYFYSLLSHLKPGLSEHGNVGAAQGLFFFQGYSGPGTLGLFSGPRSAGSRGSRENPRGTSLKGERQNSGNSHLTDPFFVRFDCNGSGVSVPWFGSLVGQGKGTSSQGMGFSCRNSLKALVGKDGGKKGWEEPFSRARNGAGTGISLPCPSSIISASCQGLEFSDYRNILELSQKLLNHNFRVYG